MNLKPILVLTIAVTMSMASTTFAQTNKTDQKTPIAVTSHKMASHNSKTSSRMVASHKSSAKRTSSKSRIASRNSHRMASNRGVRSLFAEYKRMPLEERREFLRMLGVEGSSHRSVQGTAMRTRHANYHASIAKHHTMRKAASKKATGAAAG